MWAYHLTPVLTVASRTAYENEQLLCLHESFAHSYGLARLPSRSKGTAGRYGGLALAPPVVLIVKSRAVEGSRTLSGLERFCLMRGFMPCGWHILCCQLDAPDRRWHVSFLHRLALDRVTRNGCTFSSNAHPVAPASSVGDTLVTYPVS